MKLRRSTEGTEDTIHEAEITNGHRSSREGVPVLVVDGQPVPVVEAAEAGYRILEATGEERTALRAGGYTLRDVVELDEAV